MNKKYKELEALAKEIRISILQMGFNAKSAHMGGSLSCVELLTALYFHEMKVFPKNALNESRDRFIFSKAHDAKSLYAVLSRRGFFDEKILQKYEINDGILPGHSTRHVVPGVEVSAGSLGHGLSIAAGVAFSAKTDRKSFRVFALLSDGECDEGSTWEAVLFAAHHKLSNLTAIVDYNKLQGYGFTEDVLNLEPFQTKWKAFGWNTLIINGHNFAEILNSFKKAKISHNPTVIIANTIKGFGGVKKYINTVESQYKPSTEKEFVEAVINLKK